MSDRPPDLFDVLDDVYLLRIAALDLIEFLDLFDSLLELAE
jgi:hypothetical protein